MSQMRITRRQLFRGAAGLLMIPALTVAGVNVGQPQSAAAQGGPLGPLAFSTSKTTDNQPIAPATGFSKPNTVWVTFDYRDLPAGARLSRIVRFEGNDSISGDLPAPSGSSGRYAFAISASAPNSLSEGGYEVVVFVNGVQAAIGGFAVLSLPGSDSSGGTHFGNGNGDGNGNGNS